MIVPEIALLRGTFSPIRLYLETFFFEVFHPPFVYSMTATNISNLSAEAHPFPKYADVCYSILADFNFFLQLKSIAMKDSIYSALDTEFQRAHIALQYQLSFISAKATTTHSSASIITPSMDCSASSAMFQPKPLTTRQVKQQLRASSWRKHNIDSVETATTRNVLIQATTKSRKISPPTCRFSKYLQDCNDGKFQKNGCNQRRIVQICSPIKQSSSNIPPLFPFKPSSPIRSYVIETIYSPPSKSAPCIISSSFYHPIAFDSDSDSDSDSDFDYESDSQSESVSRIADRPSKPPHPISMLSCSSFIEPTINLQAPSFPDQLLPFFSLSSFDDNGYCKFRQRDRSLDFTNQAQLRSTPLSELFAECLLHCRIMFCSSHLMRCSMCGLHPHPPYYCCVDSCSNCSSCPEFYRSSHTFSSCPKRMLLLHDPQSIHYLSWMNHVKIFLNSTFPTSQTSFKK